MILSFGGDGECIDNQTAALLPKDNHNSQCSKDKVEYHVEEEDVNSSFEAKLAMSLEHCKSRRLSAEVSSSWV